MASTTHIIVQPYVSAAKGGLKPAPAIAVKTADAGRVRAQRMMDGGRVLGVAVVQTEVDEDAGDYSEPVFLARFGSVPEMAA